METKDTTEPVSETPLASPWWRYGYVWLLVAGPTAVIVAGAVTVVLAVRIPDPVLEDYYHQDTKVGVRQGQTDALMPALKARNHAATGSVPNSP
ncbi:MAG TPA: nitrogen fixation protein FixH [Methylophilaceae bacterium]|nr:nitrogen fixation protein FixH [Methylophilaceae bacterium]